MPLGEASTILDLIPHPEGEERKHFTTVNKEKPGARAYGGGSSWRTALISLAMDAVAKWGDPR